MVEMLDVQIKITGKRKSGKTIVLNLIRTTLEEHGFNVSGVSHSFGKANFTEETVYATKQITGSVL